MLILLMGLLLYVAGSLGTTVVLGLTAQRDSDCDFEIIAGWPVWLAVVSLRYVVVFSALTVSDAYRWLYHRANTYRFNRLVPRAMALPTRKFQVTDEIDPFRRMQ